MAREVAEPRGSLETAAPPPSPKVVVVMPAFNAEKTLRQTYTALPREKVSQIILVDDGSTDKTVEIARELGLGVFVHNKNYGYGANQKTCYIEALKAGADIVVMVHPDYQYDPTLLPEMIEPILRGETDIVLGSRLRGRQGASVVAAGMPWWKWLANRFLTKIENQVFGMKLSEYHTGYRAYTREVLETCYFQLNSDGFIFDQEIVAQAVAAQFRFAETEVPVRYFPEASSANFVHSCRYGCAILMLVFQFFLHRMHVFHFRKFTALRDRYRRMN